MIESNPFRPKKVKITGINRESENEFTLTVAAVAAITPGQFFQLSLPKIGEAPISVSGFGHDWIQFTIRAVGRLTNALGELQTGGSIFIRGPYGHGFPLKDMADSRLIVVAGGSGLAPVRPLLNMAIDGDLPVKSLSLIAGFKNSAGILFREELERWRDRSRLVLTIDSPEAGWNGATGLVTEHIRRLEKEEAAQAKAVVVGPPVMMKFATAEMRLLGIPQENIWVSFERLMSCGLGKCGHCKIDSTYICLEGPVLNLVQAAALID
jgi:anaerobic sulfite reductase subunit B